MHIKAVRAGGSAKNAKDYLEKKKDSKGEERQIIEVMRGNPELVTALADSLDFEHKYSSIVIAWHENDKPTTEQMNEVLDTFESVAFAGLEPQNYSYYAIRHDNHIHIIAARVELSTGNSYNIAPPGHEKTFEAIKEFFNDKYDWKSPTERTNTLCKDNLLNANKREAQELIHTHIIKCVENGTISNRDELVKELSSFGKITRTGKDYVSVQLDGHDKAIRLKGGYYAEDFGTNKDNGPTESQNKREARDTRAELERVRTSRAQYNQSRFCKKEAKSGKYQTENESVNEAFNSANSINKHPNGNAMDNKLLFNQVENDANNRVKGGITDTGDNAKDARELQASDSRTKQRNRTKTQTRSGKNRERLGGNFLNDSIKHKAIGAVRDRISGRTGQAKESLYIDANNTRGRLRGTSQKAERSARDAIDRVRNRFFEQIRRIKLKLEEALKQRTQEATKTKSQSGWLGR